MAKSIMVQGTTSNAGKSILTAGLCRVFLQDGYKPAPFKSQNMALNSFITKDGLEMGRAQVMQAEACKTEPLAIMNPILLKPNSDTGSQVIVNGTVLGNMPAAEYFKYKKSLIPEIKKAYDALQKTFDIIVIEGAGSPAEINLKENDIVNMGMAEIADAPVIIVGDIDRGGVFASLYGTIALFEEHERKRVKGTVINKFRGDLEILKPGLKMIEDLTNVPVVGVLPYLNMDIDDEDSLSERLVKRNKSGLINISVIRFPHISNFTDFNPLEQFEEINLNYVKSPEELKNSDLIILPGTKNTMGDLKWLRESGLEASILRLHEKGVPIMGICGGFQMLGEYLKDPYNTEYGGNMKGMGIIPSETVFSKEKTRTRVNGTVENAKGIFEPLGGLSVLGYEIHMGQSSLQEGSNFSRINDGKNESTDGYVKENVIGTYVHGIFEGNEFTNAFVNIFMDMKGLERTEQRLSYEAYKDQQYDLLADAVRKNINMDLIYKIMGF